MLLISQNAIEKNIRSPRHLFIHILNAKIVLQLILYYVAANFILRYYEVSRIMNTVKFDGSSVYCGNVMKPSQSKAKILLFHVSQVVFWYELPHNKTTKWPVRPAKTWISLGICPVWLESLLCTHWVANDLRFLHVHSEDSDQTGQMHKLIRVYARLHVILLVLSCAASHFNDPSVQRLDFIRPFINTQACSMILFMLEIWI